MRSFRTIALQFRLTLLLKSLLMTAAVLCILYALTLLVEVSLYQFVWVLLIIHVLIGAILKNGIFSINTSKIKLYFEKRYPELENSLFLLEENAQSLNKLAQLQREKIEKIWSSLPKRIPVSFMNSLISLLVGMLFLFLADVYIAKQAKDVTRLSTSTSTESLRQDSLIKEPLKAPIIDPTVELAVFVRPPAYTSIQPYQWDKKRAVEEQSLVSWQLNSDLDLQQARLLLNGTAITGKLDSPQEFSWQLNLASSALFSIQYSTTDSQYTSPIQRIGMIKDQPPTINLQTEHLFFKQYEAESGQRIKLQLVCSDDYGITELQMVVTVSRGKGENVQFKESKKTLFSANQESMRNLTSSFSLSFDSLGLKSGDELYLYFVAQDNKMPKHQISKSETYFLNIRDTTETVWADASGIAVDAMPEYFRSQRQIIIDTEKLIKQKNSFTKNEFVSASNEIGIDQKVLRLRYGQFLGEEFETTIAIDHASHDHHHDHDHDHDDHEHDHHHDEADGVHPYVTEMHEHDHEESDLLEQYVHVHDVADVSTFFDDAIKAQLKAALANMWEAELYLRTGAPEKALPYEYQALELIKEVQQKSRIYVERSGFKPAEINIKEKRLSGDLSKINPIIINKENRKITEEFAPAYELILELSKYDKSKESLSLDLIDKTGAIVSKALLEQDSRAIRLLEQLSLLKQALTKEADNIDLVVLVKNNLLQFVRARQTAVTTSQVEASSIINQRYLGKEGSDE